MRVSHPYASNSVIGKSISFFAREVEKNTSSVVKVEVFPNSQIYDDVDIIRAMKEGVVHAAIPSISSLSNIVPKILLFDLPFIFEDYNHVHKVMSGPIGDSIVVALDKKGYIALGFWDNGFRYITSSRNLVDEPNDLKGQSLVIPRSEVSFLESAILGTDAKSIPASRIYQTLRDYEMDASTMTLNDIYYKEIYKTQKYISAIKHSYDGNILLVSKIFWLKLQPKIRDAISKAAKDATYYEINLNSKEERDNFQKIAANKNIVLHTVSKKVLDKWEYTLQPVYSEIEDKVGKDTIDLARGASKQ